MTGELGGDEHGGQQRRIAEELERAHPAWMVLWGGYSRGFWASRCSVLAAPILPTGIRVSWNAS
jgi:hypothetical protein